MDHVKLMADPCNGRLVPAAYAQPGGGAIQRFRTVIGLGTAAGETCGIFQWTPGINEYYANGAATSSSTFSPTSNTVFGALQTANGIGTTAVEFRCLAACLRVISNASESNRAGVVYAGLTDSTYYGYNAAGTSSVQTAVGGLPVSSRMPAKHVEVLWAPSSLDQNFNVDLSGVGTGITQGIGGTQNALTFGFIGGPAASGVTLELTAVYEINYSASSGAISCKSAPASVTPWGATLKAFYETINNSPVIIDTARRALEYFNSQGGSTGRLLGAAGRVAMLAM